MTVLRYHTMLRSKTQGTQHAKHVLQPAKCSFPPTQIQIQFQIQQWDLQLKQTPWVNPVSLPKASDLKEIAI